jgi:hypothetical protein
MSTKLAKSAATVEPEPKALPSRSKLKTQLTRNPAAPAKTQRTAVSGKTGGHPPAVTTPTVAWTAPAAAALTTVYSSCIGMDLVDPRSRPRPC